MLMTKLHTIVQVMLHKIMHSSILRLLLEFFQVIILLCLQLTIPHLLVGLLLTLYCLRLIIIKDYLILLLILVYLILLLTLVYLILVYLILVYLTLLLI